ncbi:hypothetical protein PC41400_16020 [Paenibacillus chitinolyticus]|uniref:Uncharacterized protein n=1 Tax=Paenibacillus chitinolyticus TaxID=79263 RepID=A0A410WXP5_9BACL|nr:hypothetical protein PC41400_16020 [Paenibacillus chitinolyticus]
MLIGILKALLTMQQELRDFASMYGRFDSVQDEFQVVMPTDSEGNCLVVVEVEMTGRYRK